VVEARGLTLWTIALRWLPGPAKVQFEVDAMTTWVPRDGERCGATGLYELDANALLPAAPIGALIGRIGGGNADGPVTATSPAPAGTRQFAVGTFAVIDVKDTESGALFLTMNDTLAGFRQHSGHLRVRIDVAPG
jgi:hypothetical protein